MLIISANQWNKYHTLIHNISKEERIFDIHVIQPCLALPESKDHHTDTESEILNKLSETVKYYVVEGYPLLGKECKELRRSGISAHDFSYIFKIEKNTLYKDFCHLNNEGYNRICDELFQIIKKESISEKDSMY